MLLGRHLAAAAEAATAVDTGSAAPPAAANATPELPADEQGAAPAAWRAGRGGVPPLLRYLVIVAHMSRLYEYERAAFLQRLAAAAAAGPAAVVARPGKQCPDRPSAGGSAAGAPPVEGDGAGRGADETGLEDGGMEGEADYMRAAEERSGAAAAADRFLADLLSRTAPASHAPVLAALVAGGGKAGGWQSTEHAARGGAPVAVVLRVGGAGGVYTRGRRALSPPLLPANCVD